MYIVLTRDIINPDTQDYIYSYGDILPIDIVMDLHKTLGLDEIVGHLCMTIDATKKVQSNVLAELGNPYAE